MYMTTPLYTVGYFCLIHQHFLFPAIHPAAHDDSPRALRQTGRAPPTTPGMRVDTLLAANTPPTPTPRTI